MARLFHQPYTKPIPEGAEIVQHKGKPHARFKGDDGKPTLAPLNKKGTRIVLYSPMWYGEYRDANDELQREPLSENKDAARIMLNDLIRKAELGKAGVTDPFEAHRKRPLADHLEEWEAVLLAGGASPKHVKQTVACARRLIDGCRFVFMADLSGSRVQEFVARLRNQGRPVQALDPGKEWFTRDELAGLLMVKPSAVTALVQRHRLQGDGNGKARRYPLATAQALHGLRSRGRSIKTANLYLDAIKQFAAWMVQDRRMPDNPLGHLAGGNVKLDRRHDRRTLSVSELRAIARAACQSDRVFRGLSGYDRSVLYSVACASGFRADELASLPPAAFALDASPPTVTLPAANAKNGKTAVQPLPPDVVEALRGYLADRPADCPVWPGTWYTKAADMLRIDLDTCGISYAVEGPDGPLYADFHALRHSYIALLDKSGATLKEAMQLARHSDPKLTMAVYGRAQLHDLGAAVARLPAILDSATGGPQAVASTGADDSPLTAPLTYSNGKHTDPCRVMESKLAEIGPSGELTEPVVTEEIRNDAESCGVLERSSPRGTLFVKTRASIPSATHIGSPLPIR